MSTPDDTLGSRLQREREKQGRPRAAVAGRCGISEVYLVKVERGERNPSVDVLRRLAHELGTTVSYLVDGETHQTPVRQAAVSIEADVASAMLHTPRPQTRQQPPTPSVLREQVEHLWRTWQTSPTRFTDVAAMLPALITHTEVALRSYRSTSDKRREVLRAAADLYGMLRSYCRRTGRPDLSLIAADRARHAAEEADDPLRVAAARWNLGHVLLGQGEPDGAEQAAQEGLHYVRHMADGRNKEAMAGALELVMVTASAHRKRWWQARHRLDELDATRAARAGEGNIMWTVFGPTNTAMHRVSVELEAGRTDEALHIAAHVEHHQLPSRERSFTFLTQVARCYAQRREYPAVLVHLLDLEHLAPEDLARNPETRSLIGELRTKAAHSTYGRQATALAERAGVP